ncbi:MAG: bifunctional oligoribonuclease/PAP phosphatase NrnA [Candidatus Gastranaerophilales bacterium]|nr:bifunctional oligoribonuclease/PAP phosphatase NrnA [Candidatus Gastranaerophilales bacterium]
MEKAKEFENIIKNSKNILIISHVNPDGDTLGTMCALQSAIYKQFKKNAEMLILSKLPKVYDFLPNIGEAKTLDMIDKSREYDLVIAVDVASLDRLIEAQVLFNKAKFTINLDHHRTNNNYGDLVFVSPKASSSGEVLYEIFKKLGWKIDLDIATCLYTAILTDTGGFRFENTGANVFKVAAELTETGINPKCLYKKCYESKSKEIVLFQGYCVSKAVFSKDDKIVYTVIYKKDIEKFAVGDDATDGIAETLRAIHSTEIAFVVKEGDSKTCKISMRSKTTDIAKVCSKFGGGGHKFAAGCTIKSSCNDVIKKLLTEINKEIKWEDS